MAQDSFYDSRYIYMMHNNFCVSNTNPMGAMAARRIAATQWCWTLSGTCGPPEVQIMAVVDSWMLKPGVSH